MHLFVIRKQLEKVCGRRIEEDERLSLNFNNNDAIEFLNLRTFSVDPAEDLSKANWIRFSNTGPSTYWNLSLVTRPPAVSSSLGSAF